MAIQTGILNRKILLFRTFPEGFFNKKTSLETERIKAENH
jgi:hypothetical protein